MVVFVDICNFVIVYDNVFQRSICAPCHPHRH